MGENIQFSINAQKLQQNKPAQKSMDYFAAIKYLYNILVIHFFDHSKAGKKKLQVLRLTY